MIRTTRWFTTAGALALSLVQLGHFSTVGKAATVTYSSVVLSNGTASSISESSATDPVPLFGAPAAALPNVIDFDPKNFAASANGGSVDITDGQLNYTFTTISPSPSLGLSSVGLFEAGDYSLLGVGTAATQALAGASIRATVTQINGVNVAPINLTTSSASVSFNLVANPGLVQPWSLGTTLNIAGQLAPGQRATRVEIVIDNQLAALSQPGTAAFIAKKEFQVTMNPNIPEPTTAALAGLALCGLGVVARKRS